MTEIRIFLGLTSGPASALSAYVWFDSGHNFVQSAAFFSACLVRLRIHILRQCAYVFGAMLGSTADTYFASVCVRIQRNAWFDSGYMVCVTLVIPQSPWYLTVTCSAFAVEYRIVDFSGR